MKQKENADLQVLYWEVFLVSDFLSPFPFLSWYLIFCLLLCLEVMGYLKQLDVFGGECSDREFPAKSKRRDKFYFLKQEMFVFLQVTE